MDGVQRTGVEQLDANLLWVHLRVPLGEPLLHPDLEVSSGFAQQFHSDPTREGLAPAALRNLRVLL